MSLIRQSRIFVAGVIALTLLAWFGASNHCALGGMQAKSGHECCEKQGTSQEKSGSIPCCDALAAQMPALAKAPDAKWSDVSPEWNLLPAEDFLLIPQPLAVADAVATGPPGASFLLEIVFRRSQPALAPPSFVV